MSKKHQKEKIYAQLESKAILSPDDMALHELAQLAGVTIDQRIFKIILDLLKMNVSPVAIIEVLRSMCSHGHGSTVSKLSSALLEHDVSDRTHDQRDRSLNQIEIAQKSGRQVKTTSQGHQDESSSSIDYLARASSSYGQDVNSYSDVSSEKFSRDSSHSSSRSQPHLISDSSYGREGVRSHNKKQGQSSLPRSDMFITSRQDTGSHVNNEGRGSLRQSDKYVTTRQKTGNTEDYDKLENKDNFAKKRSSLK